MGYFNEDSERPILSAWVEQGFEIEQGYIVQAIETDAKDLTTDTTFGAVGAFTSVASGCLMLALSGFTPLMIIPVIALVGSALTAWNSDCSKGDRELEQKFLKDYPAVLDRITQKIGAGEDVNKVSAEYSHLFRSYVRNDRTALAQLKSTEPIAVIYETRIQTTAIAPTVLEPIHTSDIEIVVIPEVETIPEPFAVPLAQQRLSHPIAPRDIATDLGNNPQSALIFGTPGAGKGMNISNAIRTLRAKYPKLTIMMVDPKGNPAERGYWQNQVDIFESKAILKTHPRSAAEWMLDCSDKFRSLDGPKLLIWDELYATITILKSQHIGTGKEAFPCLTDFQVFLSTHLSLGPSEGIWVWGISQSANLSDLGLTSGGLSTTRIIALVSPDNVGAVEGYLATKAITAPKGGMDEIDRLMEESPVGRACYDGKTKRWYPMARLENHSGFDRDNADWNNLGKVAPPPSDDGTLLGRLYDSTEANKVRRSKAIEQSQKWDEDFAESRTLSPQERLERSWDASVDEVETTAIDERPEGLDNFPLVLTIWEYLDGKDARSMKQISGAMQAKGKISDDDLKAKLGTFDTYKDAIKTVVTFGVSKGYLKQVSTDGFEAIRKH